MMEHTAHGLTQDLPDLPRSRAARHLASCDPDLALTIRRVGPPRITIETTRQPYEALLRAIAHQQLHGRAAEAVLGRLFALHDGNCPRPAALAAMAEADLRGCGFSGSKVAALLGLGSAAAEGVVPTRSQAARMSDSALVARLIALRGIGRWTVEMLLIFTLGRPDILPVDDFGVREGWRLIKQLPAQPAPRALAEIGAAWAPYRSTAAWYLWRASDLGKKIKPVK